MLLHRHVEPRLPEPSRPARSIERLTQAGGSHDVTMDPDGSLFLSSWSDIRTPSRLRLYGADGHLVRTIDSICCTSSSKCDSGLLASGCKSRPGMVPARRPTSSSRLLHPADLVHDLCRPAFPDRFLVGGRSHAGPRRPGGFRRLPHGPPHDRRAKRSDLSLVRVQAPGRPAVLEDIKTAINWLKQKPYVDSRNWMSR